VTLCAAALFALAGLTSYLLYPAAFLLLGSLVTRLNPTNHDSKGRTEWQVLANAGVSILLILCFMLSHSEIFEVAIVVSFAIALSDTFSSEIGKRFGGRTIDLMTLKPTQKGLSGGISTVGTLGGTAGAGMIALLFYAFGSVEFGSKRVLTFLIFGFGFGGMMVDSLLGSTLQSKYLIDGSLEEEGQKSQLFRGHHWIDNNMVNFLSILIVTIGAICFMKMYFY